MRVLVSFLLALALPLQAYAAATMFFCGPLHQAPAAQHAAHLKIAAEHPAHPFAPGDHALDDAAPHHAPGIDNADAPDSADSGGQVSGKVSGQVSGKCSLCAACSGAIAPAPMPPVLGAADAPQSYRLALLERHAGFLTGGVERPPRLFPA